MVATWYISSAKPLIRESTINGLIIDALDECVIDQLQLLKLIVQISSLSSRVKLIVASRNWPQIEEQLARVAQQSRLSLDLNAESANTAVKAFIRHKVEDLSQLKRYDSKTKTTVEEGGHQPFRRCRSMQANPCCYYHRSSAHQHLGTNYACRGARRYFR